MGCKSSKDGKEDKSLKIEIKNVGIGQVDTVFTNIKEALDTCEEIRESLETAKEKGAQLSHTERLVDGKYEDTVQILLWTLSANTKGNLTSGGIKFKPQEPYLEVVKGQLSPECEKLFDSFEAYITAVVKSPLKLKEAIDKLTELDKQVPDAVKAAKEEIQGGSAGMQEKLKMVANLGKNSKEAGTKIARCKQFAEVLAESGKDLKAFVTKLPDMIKNADETGAKAFKAGHLSLAEVFEHYHTGEKKKEHPKDAKDGKKDEKKK